ncbi:organomercurial transporter MerC [Kangiella sp.]|uniref:organomercurial transporter MerC n=1 Tax=Kangiella sp. TaxID=1920245 RepID=UPI0019958F7B|nr:organomercurial transporter MerC [Kangiella sp.]MBD3653029.1 organomercurial transporter MerC [Kangiella sp.]
MIGRFFEKFGSAGVWLSALSCPACFPALGALGAVLGLGFLSVFEGIAINFLLPIFAGLALLANSYNWYQHKRVFRGILSIIGPVLILLTLYPWWQYGWSTYVFYSAIVLMMMVSIYDWVKPAGRAVCRV